MRWGQWPRGPRLEGTGTVQHAHLGVVMGFPHLLFFSAPLPDLTLMTMRQTPLLNAVFMITL